MGAFTIGALSMIGMPLTAGFIGKWFMLIAAVGTGQWFAVAVIVVSTLLNAGYFLPIVYRAFAYPAGEGKGRTEPSWLIVAPLLATATATILLFFFPAVPYRLAAMLLPG
jgi:multicomponent Na+:H+ antiporter subunit D